MTYQPRPLVRVGDRAARKKTIGGGEKREKQMRVYILGQKKKAAVQGGYSVPNRSAVQWLWRGLRVNLCKAICFNGCEQLVAGGFI